MCVSENWIKIRKSWQEEDLNYRWGEKPYRSPFFGRGKLYPERVGYFLHGQSEGQQGLKSLKDKE